MFINIQLYKHEPIKGQVPITPGRVSLDAFEVGSDDDLEARLRLSSDEESEDDSLVDRIGSKKALA